MSAEVLWYGPGDLVGRVICLAENATEAHVGIAVDGSFYEALGWPTGVRRLTGPEAEARMAQALLIHEVPLTDAALDNTRGKAWLDSQVGDGYGYLTILGDATNIVTGGHLILGQQGTCICSVLVALALFRMGWTCPRGHAPETETPHTLAADFGVPTA